MTSQKAFEDTLKYCRGHFHCPGTVLCGYINLNINLYECFSGHLS